ncbi:MAG: protein kinase domain-containing protein [Mycoplasmatales bacterium]
MLLRSFDLKEKFEISEEGLYKIIEIDKKYLPIYQKIKENPHPNLKNIKKIIIEEDNVIILEKFYFGVTLEELLKTEFSLQQLEKLIIELISAIKYLHKANIIHHDIKPNNIIFSDGKFMLIDYNISRIPKKTKKNTRYFVSDGFSPPEQYGFGPTSYASDIFSFGKTIEWVMKKSKITSINYHEFVKKSTQFDPKSRYVDIFQVEKDFENLFNKNDLEKVGKKSGVDFFLCTWGLKKDENFKNFNLMIAIILVEKLVIIYAIIIQPDYIFTLLIFYLIGFVIYAKSNNFGFYFSYINFLIILTLVGLNNPIQ